MILRFVKFHLLNLKEYAKIAAPRSNYSKGCRPTVERARRPEELMIEYNAAKIKNDKKFTSINKLFDGESGRLQN